MWPRRLRFVRFTNIAVRQSDAPKAGLCVTMCRARRMEHGKPPKGGRKPVELLLETNQGRMPQLVPIRHGRMVQSPFAFYRGSAGLMAADLADTPRSGLRVQACGDAHLMNFGGFATPERNFIFDINDLDETLPAPWEWDLKRLKELFSQLPCSRPYPWRSRNSPLVNCLECFQRCSFRVDQKLA